MQQPIPPSLFSYGAGSVSFAEIVKSGEPVFAAVLSQWVYGRSVNELDFVLMALISACIANLFAAFRANENKRLLDKPGIRERIGGVNNQFALTSLIGFLCSIPFFFLQP